ncbi:c-type cytochrome biogenesis protein CcsB [Arthrobacter sp. STN4]|uniref:c-type cytochrome biogenesis protein CcsB n=1 Tax=Arthrobacter sp. STN4 TaxID=2923276 RepID=UPI00211A8118|nr:c-type cytochrome biogenesis protein CcsB [Arthrobacter sp. STN4]MCQ9164169.1 c-type cytochrome biogenesis protein CcsB [Arthrobacter sp. STN4]
MPTINEAFALYSERFMLLAGIAYVAALIAFAWDLVNTSKTGRTTQLHGVAYAPASQPAVIGQKIPARAGTTGHGTPGFQEAASDLEGPEGRAERPTNQHSGPHPGLMADDSMRYGLAGPRKAARIGVTLTVLAAAIHAAAVLARGLAAGRVPWGNMYEFCTTGALVVTLVFLLVLTRRDLRFVGTFVIGLVLVMLTAASVAFWTPAGHLVPALQSYWLVIHVSIAVVSSALFTLTFALSVLQLLQSRRETSLAADKPDRLMFLRLVPSALSLENMAYRINAIAFIGWTLTLMFGAIWAEKAWGRFWGWDTKEVWTFVIWVVYAGYLHARATRGWTGTRAAWLSIVGYLCVVFNFAIVNVFFSGLHSYAGVGS